MTKSMTGFGARKGVGQGYSWDMDIRSVNARGLDVRLRVPDWVDGLETAIRNEVQAVMARGSVTMNIKLTADTITDMPVISDAGLEKALHSLQLLAERARSMVVEIAPPSAVEVLQMRGVTEQKREAVDSAPLCKALVAEARVLLADFEKMRVGEGAKLQAVLAGQMDQIESLTGAAAKAAAARKPAMAQALRDNLALVLDNSDGADPDRVAQELALIAVKTDVTEEIDRLGAHVEAARELLAAKGPVGRKLDFLSQEFNREANTLCSKAQSKELTRIGLDLKAVIDQMREQVQNVE